MPKKPSPRAARKPTARKPAVRKASPKAAPVKPSAKLAPEGTAEAKYHYFLPAAQKIEKGDILPYRLDPVLALQNIQTTLKALEPHLPALRKALPQLDWKALLDLPFLAQAVTFAATQVEGQSQSLGTLRDQLTEAAVLRSLLLSTAGAMVLAGVLPAPAIERIRRGSGPIDLASDLVGLAALYRKHPDAMTAQRLVTGAHLDQAAQLGTELLTRLKPAGTRTSTARSGQADVVARDRLATLLWQRHGELRKAAYYLWGDDFERHAPALQSRKNPRKSIPPAPPKPSPSAPPPKPEK